MERNARSKRPSIKRSDSQGKSSPRSPATNSHQSKQKSQKRDLEVKTRGSIRNLNLPLDEGTYIIFDIETTGGNPERNGITEIFALRYSKGSVVDTFYSMVNPGIPIPPIVRRMTGITNRMVKDAPKIQAVMPKFIKFIGQDVLVSHNTIGDLKFLRYYSELTSGKMISNYFLCTHLLVEKLLSSAPDKSLKGLSQHLSLETSGKLHRAEADAYLSFELFKILLSRMKERGISCIIDGIRFQGDFESGIRLGWAVSQKEISQLPESSGIFYLKDQDNKITFLASSLNIAHEVRKLARIRALPRQLLKTVLASRKIEVSHHPDPVSASLEEIRQTIKYRTRFIPSNWHQRTANFLYLSRSRDSFCFSSGPLIKGTVFAVGPIRRGKEASAFMENVASILGRKISKRGLRINPWEAVIIQQILSGGSSPLGLVWRMSRLLWPPFKEHIDKKLATEEKLNQLSAPQGLSDLQSLNGILLIPINEQERVFYSISKGFVQDRRQICGNNDEDLQKPAFLKALLKNARPGLLKPQLWPLSQLDAGLINAISWWITFGTRSYGGQFIPASDVDAIH